MERKKGGYDLLCRSMRSFAEHTDPTDYRLTVVDDTGCVDDGKMVPWGSAQSLVILRQLEVELPGLHFDHVIAHRENLGLAPSINQGLVHVDALKRWDGTQDDGLTLYLQDDVLFHTKGWLPHLVKYFLLYERQHKLGFASGIESIEHPMRSDLGNGFLLKDWVRATCLLGRHRYFMSMWPTSRIDPETGQERGRPHDGLGSSVDWWWVRNHENSVCKTGRTNLVMPGLLTHLGYDRSTWLKRELPESDSDKEKMGK